MQTRDISGVLITGTRNGRYSVFQIEVLNNGEWQTAVIASIEEGESQQEVRRSVTECAAVYTEHVLDARMPDSRPEPF
jgi:hypothetical protein